MRERERETTPELLSRRSGGNTIDFLQELNRLWNFFLFFFACNDDFYCSCASFLRSNFSRQPSVFHQVGHSRGRGQQASVFQKGSSRLCAVILTFLRPPRVDFKPKVLPSSFAQNSHINNPEQLKTPLFAIFIK